MALAFAAICWTGCDPADSGRDPNEGESGGLSSEGDSSGEASETGAELRFDDPDELVESPQGPRIGGTFDVGIIPATTSCPVGSAFSQIHMDDEDRNNASQLSGWVGATYDRTTLRFCRVDGSLLRPLTGASPVNTAPYYAVLKMGSQCPNGSLEFARHFDNEDKNNANSTVGDIQPSSQTNNTTLVFCLFRYAIGQAPSMAAFPDYGISYGVFADYSQTFPPALAKGYIKTDDEDNNNANWYSAAADWINDAQRIITPGNDTYLEVARVR